VSGGFLYLGCAVITFLLRVSCRNFRFGGRGELTLVGGKGEGGKIWACNIK